MLGPVLERIHYELLDPLIGRTFQLAWEAGMIPQPPADLDLANTQIEYVSILSQAQKAVGVSRIEQSVQFLGSMVSVYPELRHALDPRKTYMEYNNMIGVRSEIFASDEGYRKAVAAEKQQQAQAQGLAAGESLATSAKLMSDVDPANIQQLLTGGVGGMGAERYYEKGDAFTAALPERPRGDAEQSDHPDSFMENNRGGLPGV